MDNTKTRAMPATNLDENIKILEELFADCQDYIGRKFPPGGEGAPWIYTAYIDAMTDRELTDMTVIRRLFDMDWASLSRDGKPMDLYTALRDRGIATADLSEADNWDDVLYFIHTGFGQVFHTFPVASTISYIPKTVKNSFVIFPTPGLNML